MNKRNAAIIIGLLALSMLAQAAPPTPMRAATAALVSAGYSVDEFTSQQVANSVHFWQYVEGIQVYGGEIIVVLDGNSVLATIGQAYTIAETFTQPALTPTASGSPFRLYIVPAGLLGCDRDRLAWMIQNAYTVYWVDAQTGATFFEYPNVQSLVETYSTTNCYALPGTKVAEDGTVTVSRPLDEIERRAHDNMMAAVAWYATNADGLRASRAVRSTVHSGVPTGFTCDQNNAAFLPTFDQFAFGDGDGVNWLPFGYSLDIVAHEHQHRETWYRVLCGPGTPCGLAYHDEPGALNEAWSDGMGSIIENRNWMVGEDSYTPYIVGDSLRNLANPHATGNPDCYAEFDKTGSQSKIVHVNATIMGKAFQLMSEGGTHYGITVQGMGTVATGRIMLQALDYIPVEADHTQACQALIAAADTLYPAMRGSVVNACAAIGIGTPGPQPTPTYSQIPTETPIAPTPTCTSDNSATPYYTFTPESITATPTMIPHSTPSLFCKPCNCDRDCVPDHWCKKCPVVGNRCVGYASPNADCMKCRQ